MKITKHQNNSVLPILQSGQGFTWTPEGLKTEELATWDSVSREIKQLTQDINNKEYEEHRRNNDVRFTGEKALEPEDWKFAAALAGGIGTTQAASTMGWVPAITTDVASGIGGTAAGYGSNWIGQKIDNKFGTNVTPWLTAAGSLLGGVGGGIAGYKGVVKGAKYAVDNGIRGYSDFKPVIQEQILPTTQITQEPLLNIGWAPKQTIDVRRAGDLTEMYYPGRWDVVEEGANPFGVWLQGKFGIPRTDITNPGKGAKAKRARELFAERPQYSGQVTLDKPIQTVGEVPNRSTLSYDAERMGADGIIYNNVYDNGYNNNQVIFSFNKPLLQSKSDISKKIDYLDIIDMDDLPEYTPSLEKSLNEFSYYRGNSENYERGRAAIKEYLQSEDYANQIKKNIPDASEKEIKEIVQKQIDYIDNANVWLSDRNISEPGVDGETIHTSGYPEIRIYETGIPNYDRMTAKHEWLHAARGPGDSNVNPFWDKLYWNGLIGEGLSRNVGVNKQWYVPANLDLLEFKPHSIDKLTKGETAMMRYLANSDEARVRALKIRDYMNQTGKTYDEVAEIVSNPKHKDSPIGDIHQLFEYFTPESIKKYVDKIMTIGVPVTVGTTLKTPGQTEHYKQGGTLPYYLKHFNYNG